MSNITQSPAQVGRTRWRRFGVAAAGGFGAVAVIAWLAATGALALSFAFSGIPFTLTAGSLTGTGFVQYAFPDRVASAAGAAGAQTAARALSGNGALVNNATAGGNTYVSDTISQFRTADITNLNQVICAPSGLGNNIRVVLSGSGTTTASNLVIQSPALRANSATFNNIIIGESVNNALTAQGFAAGSDFTDPYGALGANAGTVGTTFAQNATNATLTGINQVGIGTMAGTFAISGLNLYAEFVSSCTAPSGG